MFLWIGDFGYVFLFMDIFKLSDKNQYFIYRKTISLADVWFRDTSVEPELQR